ncbi:metallopeptidase family protein [Roseomonas sp. PWR1]|uniref:Metallopeptidase family protein n=1 Tax=Roseomonas nitratireducens TaxID=2820810 RepID=A0ABS4ANC9_9PROT|nr:metallopeptidase family protein [Neoroseomonas nitratireducens]MBP0462388.1 metallopeptidase family protein [Neoroseomonas nitratireducens]
MRFSTPPGLDDLVEMAEHALAAIPEPLRDMVRGTAILVEDMPDEDVLREMGIESPWELTGLYQGVPLIAKSTGDVPREPDRILLYREPILLEWIETGEDLFRLVRNVLIHEIGHHFGLSDEDIARLEED